MMTLYDGQATVELLRLEDRFGGMEMGLGIYSELIFLALSNLSALF